MVRSLLLTITLFSLSQSASGSNLCRQWSEQTTVGELDGDLIPEASGLAASKIVPGRYYHINDSGDGPFFYHTNLSGEKTEQVEVLGFAPKDVEDLAIGNCDSQTCLVIADIGDNKRRRASISFVLIADQQSYDTVIEPIKIIEARYPDGARDAEAVAFHPNGDLFIFSKELYIRDEAAYPAHLYRLNKSKISAASSEPVILDKVGTLDLTLINEHLPFWGQVPTAMDISDEGDKFILLTYANAVEFNINLGRDTLAEAETLIEGQDYTHLAAGPLNQQEAITYFNEAQSILFNSEHHSDTAPMVVMDCLE